MLSINAKGTPGLIAGFFVCPISRPVYFSIDFAITFISK